MTQLNSSFLTALQRRYLPFIISVVLLATLGAVVTPPVPPLRVVIIAIVLLASVALVYFFAYRVLIYKTADRVVLDGDLLRVTRGGREAAIPVASITAIHNSRAISPETITLELAAEGGAERSVAFIPSARLRIREEHPILAQLRAVMDAARNGTVR